MKYAIVESGGKQYRAVPGGFIEVDRLEAETGGSVQLDVLLVAEEDGVSVGTPFVAGKKVKASVLGEVQGPKVIVFKYKPKKRYRRKTGHRQRYTRLQIESLVEG